MTVDEADASIAAFRTQSHCATQNLIELAEWPIYKCLHGENGTTPLEFTDGSRTRINAALTTVDRLWERIALFDETLAHAKKIRDSIWLLDTESKLFELEKLLTGPSISVRATPTPLERRTLITAAQPFRTLSLKELMAELSADFELAKEIFLAVDAAIHESACASAAFEKSLAELRPIISALGNEALRRDLAALTERDAELTKNLLRDPLLCHDALKALSAELERIKTVAFAIERERTAVASELKRAADSLKELRDLNTQGRRAAVECREKIEGVSVSAEPLTGSVLDDLQNWLDKLNAQYYADFTPLKVALPKFRSKVDAALQNERRTLALWSEWLNQWMELNGRFLALRAKTQAMLARGTPRDPQSERLANEAEAALNRRPSSLEKAAKCVRDYENQLAAQNQIRARP